MDNVGLALLLIFIFFLSLCVICCLCKHPLLGCCYNNKVTPA